MLFTSKQMKESRAGNHRSVIGTELNRRILKTDIKWPQFSLQACSEADIGRYSSREHYLLYMILLCCKTRLDCQYIHNGFLKTRGQ